MGLLNLLTRENTSENSPGKQLAPYAMTYDECKKFVPLRDGDKVFCTKVYDGDTVTLCWLDNHGEKVRIGCRIYGIDTPELRGSSDDEKMLALRAKERLSKEVLNKFVTVRNEGVEKYGRVLADLSTDDHESIMEYMLEDSEICKPYSGGKKQKWE